MSKEEEQEDLSLDQQDRLAMTQLLPQSNSHDLLADRSLLSVKHHILPGGDLVFNCINLALIILPL